MFIPKMLCKVLVALSGIYGLLALPSAMAALPVPPCTYCLQPYQTMTIGQTITSANGAYALTFQTDGNLVLHTSGGTVLWSSATTGEGGVSLRWVGWNLLMYKSDGETSIWSTGYFAHPTGTALLEVTNDGHIKQYAVLALWNSGTASTIETGNGQQFLTSGQTISLGTIWNVGTNYQLNFQSLDGNLVNYRAGTAVWNSHTQNKGASYATMQTDGNFVIYTAAHVALFNTGTEGNPGAYLCFQTDDNLVVYGIDQLFAAP